MRDASSALMLRQIIRLHLVLVLITVSPMQMPANALWSDDLHYVRAATAKDPHPMRFVVLPIRRSGSKFSKRHVASLSDGIDVASVATKQVVRSRKGDGAAGDVSAVPVSSQRGCDDTYAKHPVPPQRSDESDATHPVTPQTPRPRLRPIGDQRKKPRAARAVKPVLPTFALSRFTCVRANSVAQVWKCIKHAGTTNMGRRGRGGALPKQTVLPHAVGEFAVTRHADPEREDDGSIKVYRTIADAEHAANWLYWTAVEDERFPLDKPLVYSTFNIDVMFDPINNDEHKPFSLYIPYYFKEVPANLTAATISYDRSIQFYRDKGMSEQMCQQIEQSRTREKALSRRPTFSAKALMFRSIEGAVAHAEQIERDQFQGRYLGPPGGGTGT